MRLATATEPDVFEEIPAGTNTYVARVFSPYNISRTDPLPLNQKYDFMVAITGSSEMNTLQKRQLQDRIAKEFNEFLKYTTIPAFFIIAFVVILLTFYAYCVISRRINNLTRMVENPHQFRQIQKNAQANAERDLDEIARLENIFAQFYNEERVQGGQERSVRENKKVSMLPMKSSLNLLRDNPDPEYERYFQEHLVEG